MEGLGKQSLEEFWGAELSSKKKLVSWEADDNEVTDDMFIDKSLELRQACLGVSAKEGERNVVQITAENDEGEEVRHTILSMRVGGTEQSSLFLSLNPPVSFELVSGSGPVHIVGSLVETMTSFNDSSDDSMSDEEMSSSEIQALVNAAKKKRPASSPVAKPAKQMKLDSSTSDNNSTASTSAKPTPAAKNSKKHEVVQEESDEDEDDEDDELDDEDMSDDDQDMFDEEDDDESEEEEEEIKPPTKKPQNNNNKKTKQKELTKKLFKFETPQPAKPAKTPKGTKSAPTTPKQSEKKGMSMSKNKSQKKGRNRGGISLDEAKRKLLKQLPGVPKKLEKFNNFVSNSFKIKDDSVKKELWEFVQKSR